MKKTYRFGYLFALLAVFGLFACNENGNDDEDIKVNDSAFVGVWNLKSYTTQLSYDLLDSLDNVFRKVVNEPQQTTFDDATIEFMEDYTALSIINGDDGSVTTGSYLWEDLDESLVLRSLYTYQKAVSDTMHIAKSGNAVTLTTTRKANGGYTEKVDYYDEELDSTYQVSKSYNAILYTDITIALDK